MEDKKECINCGKSFLIKVHINKNLKNVKQRESLSLPIRKSNCITCSHECSKTYNRFMQSFRIRKITNPLKISDLPIQFEEAQ